MTNKYVYTNNKPEAFKKVTVKELIEKYTILVNDYRSTMKPYIPGTAEYENLRVQAEVFEMILQDLKSLRI